MSHVTSLLRTWTKRGYWVKLRKSDKYRLLTVKCRKYQIDQTSLRKSVFFDKFYREAVLTERFPRNIHFSSNFM